MREKLEWRRFRSNLSWTSRRATQTGSLAVLRVLRQSRRHNECWRRVSRAQRDLNCWLISIKTGTCRYSWYRCSYRVTCKFTEQFSKYCVRTDRRICMLSWRSQLERICDCSLRTRRKTFEALKMDDVEQKEETFSRIIFAAPDVASLNS